MAVSTINAIAGIKVFAVGIQVLVIGKMTEDSMLSVEEATDAATYESISNDSTYFPGDYTAVDAMLESFLRKQKVKS